VIGILRLEDLENGRLGEWGIREWEIRDLDKNPPNPLFKDESGFTTGFIYSTIPLS
jgi:hypothetical protein|tara:strand:+ start:316 stop:483 length:168 start_codon:yes stop_codon:yes gene_type:complete